ncbi:CE112 protein, partial [Mionectes macconnelli]|nr:CE112 protein [Mionectes macconnelli]
YKMSSEDEISEKLDTELDHYIVAMKPYILKQQDKYEREICALWIKKLCRPSAAGVGVEGRKNRNLYAKLLLHMLKRGVLEGPFAQKPERGLLKTLPSYMTAHIEELSSAGALSNSAGCLPEWVLGELENSEDKEESSLSTTQGERPNEKPSDISHSGAYLQRTGENDLGTSLSVRSFSFFSAELTLFSMTISFDANDLEARLNSWNLGVENPRYLREKPMPKSLMTPKIGSGKRPSRDQQALLRAQERELEMKMKITEGKFHEEKLKLQQKHHAEVQKILDRKNDEIEVLKYTHEKKQKEAEEVIRRLEKKVQTVVRESQVVRAAKEQQIEELKKMCEQSNDSLKNEWEKRV